MSRGECGLRTKIVSWVLQAVSTQAVSTHAEHPEQSM